MQSETSVNTALRTGDDFENCCVHVCRCMGGTVLIAQGAHTEARGHPQGLILICGELSTDPGLPCLCPPVCQSIPGSTNVLSFAWALGSKLGSLCLSFQSPVVLFRDLFSFVSGRLFPRCTEGPEPISFSRVVISGSESTDSVGRKVQGTLFVLSRL